MIISTAGAQRALVGMVNGTVLRLFVNEFQPSRHSQLTDFVEAENYEPFAPELDDWTFDGDAAMLRHTFAFPEPIGRVCGYYLTAGSMFVAGDAFGPYRVMVPDDSIEVQAIVRFKGGQW